MSEDKELFELCQAVYKAFPEWNDTLASYEQSAGIPVGEPYVMYPKLEKMYGLWTTNEVKIRTPVYTADYLLDKLPHHVSPIDIAWNGQRFDGFYLQHASREGEKKYWHAYYLDKMRAVNYGEAFGDTPLKALLKLVLALHEAGVLK